MIDDKNSGPAGSSSRERRSFLKTALAFSAVLLTAGLGGMVRSLSAPPKGSSGNAPTTFPKVLVANLTDLTLNKPIEFNYPLQETPNLLVKLGATATGGIGPDSDIVAFSMICQHLGCIYGYVADGQPAACNPGYRAQGPVGYCCCHGTVYNLAKGGAVLAGPSLRPVPQVILELDSSTGDIYATGMTPPTIYGYDTGSNDVLADLRGGTLSG